MNTPQKTLTRRALLGGATALAAGTVAAAQGLGKTASAHPEAIRENTVVLNESNAVVETSAGKIWGFTRNGIQTFKGIPYAASTEGKARFLPPAKPVPWTGLRCAQWFGKICPQVMASNGVNDISAIIWERLEGQPGEDCLNLNVWSPALDRKKRPVMVWLHGGGFQTGHSMESPNYHGENLSRRGDVVVVSVNHRLGVLGFLDLSAHGPQYADSSNLGLLDLVAALEWVHDNIDRFGGDPANVTIFGQSGGGGKVSALMSMPSAKGLFHKAVVESGSLMTANTHEQAAELTTALLDALGLTPANLASLHDLPVERLIQAGIVARKKVSPPSVPGPQLNRGRQIWGPNLHEKVLPWAPFDPQSLHLSAGVPLMVGTARDEITPVLLDYSARLMTEEQLKGYFARAFGAGADAVIAACRKLYPGSKVFEVAAIVSAVVMYRFQATLQAERKAAQGQAPAYLYQFNWQTKILDGQAGAFHCSEIPFVFDNTDVAAMTTGGGAEPRALAAKVSDAWINFARHGNPNHPGLPQWPAFNPTDGPAMIFDRTCQVKNDYERELRTTIAQAVLNRKS